MKKLVMLFSASCIFTVATQAQAAVLTNSKDLLSSQQQSSAKKMTTQKSRL